MKGEDISDVVQWIKTTDLVEVSYKKSGKGFSFSSGGATTAQVPYPGRRLKAVCAETVGIFQFNEPGKARVAEEGTEIAAGGLLGVIESLGSSIKISAPIPGRVHKVCVDSGDTVQYGQPLFFIEE